MRPLHSDPRHSASGRRTAGSPNYIGPPTTHWGRYSRYLGMRARVRLAYRGDLILNAAGNLLVSGIGVVFLWAVFRNVPDIVGWTFHEVLFVWGFSETVAGLFFVAFQGLWLLNTRYLIRGELDRVLLRPLNPLAQILLDNFSLDDLPVAILGMGMMAVAIPSLMPFSILQWILLPVFVLGGVCVLGGFLTGLSAIGFYVHHRGTAIGMVYHAYSFSRFPIDIFHRRLQILLMTAIPFAFCGFLPATWYMGRDLWFPFAVSQPFVGLSLLVLGVGTWHRALRNYRSVGA